MERMQKRQKETLEKPKRKRKQEEEKCSFFFFVFLSIFSFSLPLLTSVQPFLIPQSKSMIFYRNLFGITTLQITSFEAISLSYFLDGTTQLYLISFVLFTNGHLFVSLLMSIITLDGTLTTSFSPTLNKLQRTTILQSKQKNKNRKNYLFPLYLSMTPQEQNQL